VCCKNDFRRVPSANPAKERGAGSPLGCSRHVRRSRVSAPRPSGRPFAGTRAASQFCNALLGLCADRHGVGAFAHEVRSYPDVVRIWNRGPGTIGGCVAFLIRL